MTRNLSAVVRVSPDQVSCDLAGEAAILNLNSGAYYGLDPIGARIWNLMKEPATVVSIRDAIVAEYDVSTERCERDLLELLARLEAEGDN